MSIVVLAHYHEKGWFNGCFEAITYASELARQSQLPAYILTYGKHPDLQALAGYGITEVLVAEQVQQPDDQALANLLAEVANQQSAKWVICAQDLIGKSVAAMSSVFLQAGYISGAFTLPDQQQAVERYVFSGKAIQKIKAITPTTVLSILKNGFGIKKSAEQTAELKVKQLDFKPTGENKVKLVNTQIEEFSSVPLPDAAIVVSGGRGLEDPKNWHLVEDLAKVLHAATACSRPVADAHWRPHYEHVGQTGLTIRPNLYIAIGISGAIQHLAGVNGSKIIVVINKDPEAPFFKFAHYGIVGDAFEVVPQLIAAFKKAL